MRRNYRLMWKKMSNIYLSYKLMYINSNFEIITAENWKTKVIKLLEQNTELISNENKIAH